jgi:arabinoxylan arabinofuranohydrolase
LKEEVSVKRQCYNPYLPSWEYIPDAEPKVFGQRLYIYGSHDLFGAKEYCEGDYVCWSTPVEDLSDWRYEGVIFKKQDTPWNKENLSYYAPDVVRGTDGRYYLYYSVANTSITSVAVCDKPAGKYQYLGDVHFPDGRVYGSKPEDWFMFDPAVLVDDDGRVFLYVGSGQKSNGEFGHEIKGLFVMELSSDMLTIISEPTIIMPADFNPKKPNYWEGPSIRHIGEWYYLVYPATDITGLNYAMSLFPDNAEMFKTRVDLAIDHHPSYEGFGKESCVHPECAACGEILCELAQELGQLTPEVALPLYVAVSTDTGCFVYSNVTANTHRVAAALMETGIDYKAANKLHFRTKSKKRCKFRNLAVSCRA